MDVAEFNLRHFEEELSPSWGPAFEANPTTTRKFYLNVAFPYPSGAMHVGHGRTYTVPDVIARFWRMRGYNVLFPMGFHVTGTPVIGISRRIARGDEKTIRLYRDLYHVPPDVMNRFHEPMTIVRHFSSEYERLMRRLGYSIDWRRRFITVDPQFSKFVEWQYKHLHEKNRVVRGEHPVKYCPQCDNPVGDHDLLEGDKAEIIRFTLVMFSLGDAFIPTATLRPETVYGVTNLWVNPTVTYVRANVDGNTWIVSKEAADKLRLQDHNVEILDLVPGNTLVGKQVTHPMVSRSIPILPAPFVDPDMATGMVMSVPAHAPFDFVALRDIQAQGEFPTITPIPLIRIEGSTRLLVEEAVERAGIKDQQDPRLESVTQEVYSAEFTRGRMLPEFGGLPVRQARDDVAARMLAEFGSVVMYDFDTRSVVCRCGGRVYVKILHDQWFLNYAAPDWKEQIHQQLATMTLVPPEMRIEFDRTVDWLKDWACTRRVGLGTKLPWDPAWIIEPLSDSTIYMAYYTIAHHLKKLPAASLTPEVFDYIFLGEGQPPAVPGIEEIRREFLYWYPYDYRFSAKDLISNHLTFQLFHHRAVLPDRFQPRGMVIFGMGLLNGAKMSSSKGNVVLLEDAIHEFGADTVRMFLVGSAEPWQDFDWRNELVASTRRQIERFWHTVQDASAAGTSPLTDVDAWFMSRLQQRIRKTTEALAGFQTRQALQEAYFGIEADLKWYRRRQAPGQTGSGMYPEFVSIWIRLLAPFVPYTTEKLWQECGGTGMAAFAPWPTADDTKVRPHLETCEELLMRTVEDIESIRQLIQITPASITLYTAPSWKWDLFRKIASAPDRTQVVKEVMKDTGMRKRGKAA
ncbi:MAG: leucine--tRNA ligase, partial [Methanomicrobiales archaeon]|nr:leucine--tRNA ligase [Methanomicrobiales archaeon]